MCFSGVFVFVDAFWVNVEALTPLNYVGIVLFWEDLPGLELMLDPNKFAHD